MITITTYLKKVSFLSDLCFNQNKNKLCSLHSPAFFKILKEPTLVKQTNNTSYESPNFQLLGAGQGPGSIMEVPYPHPVKRFVPFLSEVVEAKWGWWNKNWMFYIKSLYLRITEIIDFWLECHSIMKNC